MGNMKKRILLLRDFYPEAEKEFISYISRSGWNFLVVKSVANELNFDLQRALSICLEKFDLDLIDIFVSSEEFQKRWEKTFYPRSDSFISKILKDIKPSSKIGFFSKEDFYLILAKQIAYYKPDIVLVLPFAEVNHYFFSKLKKIFNFKLVGYSNATYFSFYDEHILSYYDFVFSPFLPHVFKLRYFGVKAEYIPLGFEPLVLEKLKERKSFDGGQLNSENNQKIYDVVFAGSLHQAHRSRIPFLKKIADAFGDKFHIWTQSFSSLPSELRKNFRGAVFNIDYYYVLSKSKIVLNHHGSILPWAHNLRLFETTGVGSFLLADNLPGIDELFEVGKEVETYDSIDECIDKINYYLLNEEEREKIAKAGQIRTLKDHTYEKRIEKLFEFFVKYEVIKF
jgi:spore maturation protein CgeB